MDDLTVSQGQSLTTGLLALCVPVVFRHWCLVYFVRIVRLIHRVGVRRVLVVALCVQGLGIMPYVVYSSVVHLGPQYINRLDQSAITNWPLGRLCMYYSDAHYRPNYDLSEHIIPPGGFGIERNHHPVLYDSRLRDVNLQVDYVQRYSLEDVVLFCDIVIPTDTDVEDITVTMTWYKQEILEKQGNVVRREINQTTDKARITLTSQKAYISGAAAQTQPAGERVYAVSETLQLRRIKETDFGEYVCYAVVLFSMKQKGWFPNRHSLRTCRVELRKVTQKVQEVYIPPAGILQSIASFAQLETNDDEILVERRINGQQAEELAHKSLCHPGFDLLVNFLQPNFVWLRGLEHSRHLTKKDHLMQKFATDISNICIGDVIYGIHTFKISREFYNTQTQTRDFKEVDYPRSLQVAPSFPYIFGDIRESADFTYFSECWTKKGFIKTDYCIKRQEYIDRSIA
ncbi:hypothetical protein V1264_016000 [Littorina saxatilis]|uniref:Ig-like domain-containing protein n=1 Tax=Littorina saxatilis TaxID=31220 RepID=A0AAN9GHG3_9CAEN